jgi:3-methyladenine DNA glycosylase AlkD
MTATEILDELKKLGSEQTKKTLMKHGAREPIFGVKVEDLKKIQKRVKMNHKLALELYDSGISDAMYLAGLIADDDKMTRKNLQDWVKNAYWSFLSEYTVPWVAASGPHGREMALKWIEAKQENIASAGWATYSSLVSTKEDSDLDLEEIKTLLARIEKSIHQQPNRVRSCMNGFVIAVGSYVKPLSELADKTGRAIGAVSIDVGDTACKVPFAPDYIKKARDRGTLGKKRKSAKC